MEPSDLNSKDELTLQALRAMRTVNVNALKIFTRFRSDDLVKDAEFISNPPRGRVPESIPLSRLVQCIRFRLPMEAENGRELPGAWTASDPRRSSKKGMKAVEFLPLAELIVNFNSR